MSAATPEAIHNEQVKLFASALDRAGTAAWTVGVFGPLAAAFFRIQGFNTELLPIMVGTACWALLAIILHIEAQRVLRGLVQ